MEDEWYLYIIMRSDLASMTPGRACAQAAHAANYFASFCSRIPQYKKWASSTNQGFGTTIVLDAAGFSDNLRDIVKELSNAIDQGFSCPIGVIVDPTYPIKDGNKTFYVSIETCAFIFAPKDKMKEVCDLRLY